MILPTSVFGNEWLIQFIPGKTSIFQKKLVITEDLIWSIRASLWWKPVQINCYVPISNLPLCSLLVDQTSLIAGLNYVIELISSKYKSNLEVGSTPRCFYCVWRTFSVIRNNLFVKTIFCRVKLHFCISCWRNPYWHRILKPPTMLSLSIVINVQIIITRIFPLRWWFFISSWSFWTIKRVKAKSVRKSKQ